VQNDTLVAVDIAKEVFEVGISDRPGRVVRRERPRRDRFLPFMAQLPPATVVMEACGSAHYWARRIEEVGHVVVLLPPQYVRPYVVRNKTDRTDVDALLEAFRNEQIRPVPIKTLAQQVIATLHRLRSGWLADRVRSINTLRGLLRELGFFIPEGRMTACAPGPWSSNARSATTRPPPPSPTSSPASPGPSGKTTAASNPPHNRRPPDNLLNPSSAHPRTLPRQAQ